MTRLINHTVLKLKTYSHNFFFVQNFRVIILLRRDTLLIIFMNFFSIESKMSFLHKFKKSDFWQKFREITELVCN